MARNPLGVTVQTAFCIALAANTAANAESPGQASRRSASQIETAKKVFQRYVSLEHAYDPAVADMYHDEGLIRNKRTYPTGQVRDMTLAAPQYKEMIRKAMPLAKLRGDKSTYSDCSYEPVAERVRILCKRFSEVKKYSSPISLLVGPGAKGEWVIYEELSESQP